MTRRAEPPARRCRPLVLPPGPAGLDVLLPPLRAALEGHGPALAPLPQHGPAPYLDRLRAALRPGEPVPDGVAVVAATSGSTDRPAGVLLPATALRAAAESFAERYGHHRWVAALPLHHAGGLMVAVRSVIDATAPVGMASLGGAAPFTPEAFEAATDEARRAGGEPLAVSLVPAMLERLATGPCRAALAAYDVVLVGGAACPAALVAELRSAGVRVVLSYGMTETCGGVVFDGRPLAGASVSARPDGRLVVCGPQVAAGYRDGRDPDRWESPGCPPAARSSEVPGLGAAGAGTAAAGTPGTGAAGAGTTAKGTSGAGAAGAGTTAAGTSTTGAAEPGTPGAGAAAAGTSTTGAAPTDAAGARAPEPGAPETRVRCFRSDDLGRVLPDGTVTVDGRHDDVVQVAGASVSVNAVAEALRGEGRVVAAEVVAVPDDRLGTALVALVVLRDATAPDPETQAELAELVAAGLGRAAKPRAVGVLEAIPMLASGKPDRAALKSLARDLLSDAR